MTLSLVVGGLAAYFAIMCVLCWIIDKKAIDTTSTKFRIYYALICLVHVAVIAVPILMMNGYL